jgi:hypothetical protein
MRKAIAGRPIPKGNHPARQKSESRNFMSSIDNIWLSKSKNANRFENGTTAERIPGARKGTVEIRPVLEIPGLPPD